MPGSSVGMATGYGLDDPGIESRWGKIFRTCPDRPSGPPSPLYNGYRVFPGGKSGWGVTLTPYPLLVPWSRKSRAIHLLPLWAVQPVQSLSACTRVDFTFYLLTGQQVECDLVNYSQIIVTNSEACKTNQCACLDRL